MRHLFSIGLIADSAELYNQYHRQVYAYLLRLSGSADWAEDLLQETFYRAIRGAATYRGQAPPLTWLCAIGRRLYLTEVRRRAKERDRRAEADWEALAAPEAGPETLAIHGEDRAAILQVLAALPEGQRLALLLRDWDGLPYETIAELLGLSLANIKVTIHRARIRFRALYSNGRSRSHEDI
ncbi:MAG: RNA polymerase sigma factor [Symbiobacteriia bacterium]